MSDAELLEIIEHLKPEIEMGGVYEKDQLIYVILQELIDRVITCGAQ